MEFRAWSFIGRYHINMLSFQPLHWKVRIFQWVSVFAICAVLKFEMCSWTWWRFKLIKRWISASYCKRLPVIASPCYEVEFLFTSLLFLRGVMEQFFSTTEKSVVKKGIKLHKSKLIIHYSLCFWVYNFSYHEKKALVPDRSISLLIMNSAWNRCSVTEVTVYLSKSFLNCFY